VADNAGGGPLFISRKVLPGAPPEVVPDVVILTEGTGDSKKGALGIYRGQRGRMQIEVTVTGRSCHGSMPWEGLNPLEYGGAIVSEAARRYEKREGFLDHAFLGHGTRTASWSQLETPSDCAVPDKFTFRFDRRLTVGETPEKAVADVEALDAVGVARKAGLKVEVAVPIYDQPTWKGFVLGNPQIYLGWVTPEEHPAIKSAVTAYQGVISPNVGDTPGTAGALRKQPRVDRWIFSTDGVGFPVPAGDKTIAAGPKKAWVTSGAYKHPAMFGIGPGIEQNTHKIGECVDLRELQHAIAFLARFPSVFAAHGG
ncbi:MAG: peptidase dimerization domain-containing protein, partial [Myxococcaceae bacterium]